MQTGKVKRPAFCLLPLDGFYDADFTFSDVLGGGL